MPDLPPTVVDKHEAGRDLSSLLIDSEAAAGNAEHGGPGKEEEEPLEVSTAEAARYPVIYGHGGGTGAWVRRTLEEEAYRRPAGTFEARAAGASPAVPVEGEG